MNYKLLINWIAKQNGLKPVDARLVLGEFYLSFKPKNTKPEIEQAFNQAMKDQNCTSWDRFKELVIYFLAKST